MVSLISTFLSALIISCSGEYNLELLSALYVPSSYENTTPVFKFGSPASEQLAIDYESSIVYAVGIDIVHVIDFSDVNELKILHYVEMPGYETTDVEYCGDYVFVTLDNHMNKEEGKVAIFNKYDRQDETFNEIQTLTVGSLPDMVKPNSNCTQAVVALEGEPYAKDGSLIDPEGAIVILNFDDRTKSFSMNRLDFKSYNSREDELIQMGIRKSNPTGTLAQDIEPEYITFNDDHSVAYVGLQENNAIAEVDMINQKINNLYPLGYKKWSDSSIDVSNTDGGINMRPWPIYGLYQPDSIHYTSYKGIGYLLIANEGDERHYTLGVNNGYTDIIKGTELAKDPDQLNLPLEMVNQLKDDKKLGGLHFSSVDGKNKDGKYEKLFLFGARGFSIIRTDTFEMVYDSGDDAEKYIAKYYPYLFNADIEGNLSVAEQKDLRSTHKGPEVESIAVAELLNDELIIFVGCERPGIIAFYTVTDDITKPVFNGMWSHIPNSPLTFQQMYDARRLSAVDPEDIRFIPKSKSPNGKDLLLVSGTDSGTISIVEVKLVEDKTDENGTDSADSATRFSIVLHVCLLMVAYSSA